MKKMTLIAAALATPALLALATPRDAVRFAPKEGAAVTKSFESTMELSLDDMSMLINGADPGMMPDMEMNMTAVQSVSVKDVYGAVTDGKPSKVKRTFDTIGSDIDVEITVDMMGETQDQSATGSGSSDLEGSTVIFAWDEDTEEFSKEFEDGEGDEDLLTNLSEDMDLRGLLPEGGASEGDSWDIPLDVLPDILSPGGDLRLDVEMDGMDANQMGGPDPAMMSNMREMFGDMLEGEASGSFSGTRDADGIKVAVIDIEIEINTARDMSDMMQDMMGDQIPAEVDISLDRADVEFSLEGTGTLLWNVAGGHMHSFSFKGDTWIAMDIEMGMDMGGQSMAMEMSMEMSGTVSQSIATE